MRSGLWVLGGVLIFSIVEKLFSGYVNADESNPQPKCVEIANCLLRKSGGKIPENQEGLVCAQNGSCDIEDVPNGCYLAGKANEKRENQPNKITGYLNLLANSIDNFTHGLAVAGSFLVSFRHGLLGTLAILLHEIPHEVCWPLATFEPPFWPILTARNFVDRLATLRFFCVPASVDGMRPRRSC